MTKTTTITKNGAKAVCAVLLFILLAAMLSPAAAAGSQQSFTVFVFEDNQPSASQTFGGVFMPYGDVTVTVNAVTVSSATEVRFEIHNKTEERASVFALDTPSIFVGGIQYESTTFMLLDDVPPSEVVEYTFSFDIILSADSVFDFGLDIVVVRGGRPQNITIHDIDLSAAAVLGAVPTESSQENVPPTAGMDEQTYATIDESISQQAELTDSPNINANVSPQPQRSPRDDEHERRLENFARVAPLPDMPPLPFFDGNRFTGFFILFGIIVIITILINVVMAVLVYKSAKKNGLEPAALWVIIVLLANVVGLLIYLAVLYLGRQNGRQLPPDNGANGYNDAGRFNQTQQSPAGSSTFCSNCGVQLKERANFCQNCGTRS